MLNTLGLTVEFDGKKNVVMNGVPIDYPIGGMACEYARLHPTEIKEIITGLKNYSSAYSKDVMPDVLMDFYDSLKQTYGDVTSLMVLTDFSAFLEEYAQANEEQLKTFLQEMNTGIEQDTIKKFILENTEFSEFGVVTVGQAFLSAYYSFASSYAIFRHTFNIIMKDNEDVTATEMEGLNTLYGPGENYQHIEFNLMAYGGRFHSLYTIKSSLSLILFEAAHMMDNGVNVVKCKNCGNFFVPTGRSDQLYCGFPAPQDKSKACRDIGAQNTLVRKRKNDEVSKEQRRLYMRLTMQQKRHPDDENVKSKLSELAENMKRLRSLRDDGNTTSDEILEWLQKFEASL